MDVRRLAIDGYLARPAQRRPSILACPDERSSIGGHLLVGEITDDGRREDPLHEHVLLEHDLLPGLRSHRLEDSLGLLRPLLPRDRRHDGLHVGDADDPVAVPVRPVEPESAAPVVDHQRDAIAEIDLIEKSVEIRTVFDEGVRVRTTVGELVRRSHADEVRCDAPIPVGEVGDDVAPQV
jgi:hypothetical protein